MRTATLAPVEVHRRRPTPHQLEVDVAPAHADVAQQPPVAVDLVEPRVRLEHDPRPDGQQPPQLARTPRASSTPPLPTSGASICTSRTRAPLESHDRVAVDHPCDPGAVAGRSRSGRGQQPEREPAEEKTPHVPIVGVPTGQSYGMTTPWIVTGACSV